MSDTGTFFYDPPEKPEEDPRLEFEVTVKFRYKTDPANYELTGTAENMLHEMAAFDQQTFEDEPDTLIDAMLEDGTASITVTPVAKENNG